MCDLIVIFIATFCFPLADAAPDWDGPIKRFEPLKRSEVSRLQLDWERAADYLQSRGASQFEIASYINADLSQIADALSLVFDPNPSAAISLLLGNHLHLIDGLECEIDHAGRELYGPIAFYLPLLKQLAPELSLVYQGDVTFPSIAVFQAMRRFDPNLRGVTIGRIYFENQNGGKKGSLELFQAASADEKEPLKHSSLSSKTCLIIQETKALIQKLCSTM